MHKIKRPRPKHNQRYMLLSNRSITLSLEKWNVLPESHCYDQHVIEDALCTVGADWLIDWKMLFRLTCMIKAIATQRIFTEIKEWKRRMWKKRYVVWPDSFWFDRAAVLQYIAHQQSKGARDDEVKTKLIGLHCVSEGGYLSWSISPGVKLVHVHVHRNSLRYLTYHWVYHYVFNGWMHNPEFLPGYYELS